MLELKHITKVYEAGTTQVEALKGIDIAFRENEFVAILGQSGCGKTTLLNIIGGLDRYTSGDLIINGRSTKEYDDRDWDTYRNHSIGFVFQSYNLIPHQSVLANVELALTLSGVSGEERRARAVEALEKVGLGDQLDKAPNQMSGGQMQRVAIARAIVNNPDILLADEPTGALDSETSVQIMNLLQEIAKDKLIIMVTHNPELASKYATRTVRLLDGRIVGDDNPCTESETSAPVTVKVKEHTSMSFATAMSLSLHNLMTKKARTLLTAFAGSIGIIGIALILSLSHGFQSYINTVQEQMDLVSRMRGAGFSYFDHGFLLQQMNRQNFAALGILYGSNLVGACVAAGQYTSAEVMGLYIVPEFQRKGLGTRLLQQTKQALASTGVTDLTMRGMSDSEPQVRLVQRFRAELVEHTSVFPSMQI